MRINRSPWRKIVPAVLTLVLTASVFLAACNGGQGTTPMPNSGKIAFVGGGEEGGIFIINGDGTCPVRLITKAVEPAFSHDGTRIAFSSWANEIYVMNADGSGVTKLTDAAHIKGSPAWSPDDSQIAFAFDHDGQPAIYIMNADGTNVTRITNDPALSGPLSWSPDGSRIAGVSRHDAPSQPTPPKGGQYPIIQIPNIFIMNCDGTHPTVITNEDAGFIYGLSWSPDGAKIAYDWIYPPPAVNCYESRGIKIINTDGSDAVLLPTPAGAYPSWSPDGRQIVYSTVRVPPTGIYVINAEGTGMTRLTNFDLHESHPSWASGTWSAPVVTTDSATDITDKSAMLNGTLVSMGQASTVQVAFKWDTAPGVTTRSTAETNAVTLTAPGPFSIHLTGLSASQKYYFVAETTSNGVTFGQELGFMASLVATDRATDIGVTSVTLNGMLYGKGRCLVSATDYFEYGLTTDYGSETAVTSQINTGSFSATLANLLPGAIYHFRAVGTVQDVDTNNGTMYGSDLTFTTLPSTPIVENIGRVTIHPDAEVVLHGSLLSLGTASSVTVLFEWGATTAYGQTTEAKTLSSPGDFASMVTGLTSGATYHFRADATGNGTAYSDDFAFIMP